MQKNVKFLDFLKSLKFRLIILVIAMAVIPGNVIRAGILEDEQQGTEWARYHRLLEYLTDPGNLSLTQTLLLDAENYSVTEAIAQPIRELVFEQFRKNHPDINESIHRRSSLFWTYGMYGLIKDWLRSGSDRDIEHIAEAMAASVRVCGDWESRD